MLRRVALVRTTWRNIPEDAILHSHRRENLKSYTLSVDTERMEFNLNGPSNSVIHLSGFCGEGGGIDKLNAVSLADTVFSYGRLVRIF
jgi:hypothetical protein